MFSFGVNRQDSLFCTDSENVQSVPEQSLTTVYCSYLVRQTLVVDLIKCGHKGLSVLIP